MDVLMRHKVIPYRASKGRINYRESVRQYQGQEILPTFRVLTTSSGSTSSICRPTPPARTPCDVSDHHSQRSEGDVQAYWIPIETNKKNCVMKCQQSSTPEKVKSNQGT
jgi:hypothetical protein